MRLPVVLFGLIGFDLLRVRRGFEAVLVRWQDRVTLALMAAFAALAAISMIGRPPAGLAVPPSMAALAAFLLAAVAAAAQHRRLEALARGSVVAPLALAPAARAAYFAVHGAGLLTLALLGARAAGVAGLFGARELATVLLAWAAGTLAGVTAAALWRRRRRLPALASDRPAAPRATLVGIALRSQFPALPPRLVLAGAFAAGAAQALAVGLWIPSLNPLAGGAVALTAALAVLLLLARVPAAACRFGAFAGVPVGHALGAWLAVPAAAALGAIAGALPHRPGTPALLWLELGCGLLAAAIAALRLLHYRRYERARADRLMQAQAVILALAAAGLPPLAPLLVVFRAVALYRADRRALWAAW